jgi:hypothetical protein
MKNLMILLFFGCIIVNMILAQGGKTSLYFAGGNDIVWCGNDSSLNIQDAITLEAWIKSDGPNSSYARILDKYRYHGGAGYNLVRRADNGAIMLDFFATDNSKHTHGSTTTVFDNQWHYVAVTFSGTVFIVYVDGQIEEQDSLENNKQIKLCSDHFAIGNGWDGATWFPYRGQIDEARVWDTAIDSATIRYWMYREVTIEHPYYNHLKAYWKFNEGEGSVTSDSSHHNNHGQITDMDTLTAWLHSSVPLSTDMTNQLHDLSAVWPGSDSAWSSIFAIKGNMFSNNASVLFGHDNEAFEWIDSDVPGNKGILNRLDRVWRVETYDTIRGNLMYDLSEIAHGHQDDLVLLVDSDGVFDNADTLNGRINSSLSLFTVSDTTIKHGYYYTLGSRINILSAEKLNDAYLARTFRLHQNFPNPFNPSTTIKFYMPKQKFVELKVYNILGKEVSTLVANELNPGNHVYTFDGKDLASGIYYCQLVAGDFRQVRKMILIK